MTLNTDIPPQNSSSISRGCSLAAVNVWRQLDDIRRELHTIHRAEQIMVEGRFTPQWNDLVERVQSLSENLEPGASVSAQALVKRMIMVVRVNLGAPGREDLRRVYGF